MTVRCGDRANTSAAVPRPGSRRFVYGGSSLSALMIEAVTTR
jgi:hypothetical protein